MAPSKPKTHLSFLDICLAIRDSRLVEKPSELNLLFCLALRADARKQYSCFPSYATLSKDTCLHPSTIQEGAQRLESIGLIQRKVRRPHSNLWFLNVVKIKEAADKNRLIEKADKEDFENPKSPFDQPAFDENYDVT